MATDIILTSSTDGPIIAQDHITGAVLAQFSVTRSPRKGLTFTSGGLIAASHVTPSASGFIHLFNWWSSSVLQSVPVPEPVAPLVATPNGSFLFAGGLSGHIYILSLPSCDLLRSFPAHQRTVSCLTINSDGSLVISGSDDGTIAVFQIISLLDISSTESSDDNTVQTLYKFIAHSMSITGIASGSTGGCNSIIISCSLDCMIKFWSLANGACLRTVHLQCALWSVILDLTDAEAYAGGSDGRVYGVALKKMRRRGLSGDEDGVVAWSAEESGGAVIALAMVNGDRNLVSASEDGTIMMWEAGQVVKILRHGQNGVSDLLVARGVSRAAGGVRRDEGNCFFNGLSSMPCVEGMHRDVKEMEEMQQWLGVVVKDRRRAIDVLETAIKTYKRLLGLLLKEANLR
ncbi:pre-rRNA-processing protein IPI3 protein [Dioscorea alata]|uniref:Pre-rRNA-processing protein IPI3 protein n=1 Tax=Dioscorea alata TaxID=55571 RepID=A0ACB7VJR8_DIOAL|nr:pre-rRNA-processing protein IPI3 protein [Dioscorea alata]